VTSSVADAYSATAPAWQAGPGRVYDRLAEVVAEACPVPLASALVLDLGAGTGAATRAAQRRGADVVAVDVAFGMLAADAGTRPPAAVGDVLALPFADGAFHAVLAAFSLNHVDDPVAGLREAVRVLRPGGGLVAASYSDDDDHPVKEATEAAARDRGWRQASWYEAVRSDNAPRLGTIERASEVANQAGLMGAAVANIRVQFPDFGPHELVAWRLGLAHLAPFVARLPPAERVGLVADAVTRLGADPPILERSLILLTWSGPGE
jgi:ubiquinone/menaquinone biosynthesis C-methylase UbiE